MCGGCIGSVCVIVWSDGKSLRCGVSGCAGGLGGAGVGVCVSGRCGWSFG